MSMDLTFKDASVALLGVAKNPIGAAVSTVVEHVKDAVHDTFKDTLAALREGKERALKLGERLGHALDGHSQDRPVDGGVMSAALKAATERFGAPQGEPHSSSATPLHTPAKTVEHTKGPLKA